MKTELLLTREVIRSISTHQYNPGKILLTVGIVTDYSYITRQISSLNDPTNSGRDLNCKNEYEKS
jgi:hypothetical protein